jgi:predicted esterase
MTMKRFTLLFLYLFSNLLVEANDPAKNATIDRILDKLSQCETKATEPLLKDHFYSMRLLFEQLDAFRKAGVNDTASAREIEECGSILLADLEGPGSRWETYLAGRPLVMVAPNYQDLSLQSYLLTLPENWNQNTIYPMVFMLHGGVAGLTPLRYAMFLMEFPVLAGAKVRHKTNANKAYYLVSPYLRGNKRIDSYTDGDISMIMNHMIKKTNVDQDRVYCAGFSLGAMNTWTEAFARPDRWAAVLVHHGALGYPDIPMESISNAANFPFRISTGENDKISVIDTKKMSEYLTQAGIRNEVEIRPGVGHEIIGIEEGIQWMMQFKRNFPSSFSFVSPLEGFNGTRGITMERPKGLAGFQCKIEGHTIVIDVKGCKNISVDPSHPGLGMKGETALIINGTSYILKPPFPDKAKSFPVNN